MLGDHGGLQAKLEGHQVVYFETEEELDEELSRSKRYSQKARSALTAYVNRNDVVNESLAVEPFNNRFKEKPSEKQIENCDVTAAKHKEVIRYKSSSSIAPPVNLKQVKATQKVEAIHNQNSRNDLEKNIVKDTSQNISTVKHRRINTKINFDLSQHEADSAALKAQYDRAKSLGKIIKAEVKGYTDSTGPLALNTYLARRRADYAVKALNFDLDIDISIEGKPMCCYLAPNNTKEGRALNRRAEVVFHVETTDGIQLASREE